MIRKVLCLLLVITIAFFSGSCENVNDKGTRGKEINNDDFSLIKDDVVIKLNMSKEDFMNVTSVDNFESGINRTVELDGEIYRVIEYDYEGLRIVFSNVNWYKEGRAENCLVIVNLSTRSNQWDTLRGVKVTDDMDKTESYYGEPMKSQGLKAYTLYYQKDDNIISFTSDFDQNDVIGSISISSNHQEKNETTLQSEDDDNSNGHSLFSSDEVEEMQREVQKIYLSHLENLINGDYKSLLEAFSEDYVEPTDRFINLKPNIDENYLKGTIHLRFTKDIKVKN